MGAPKPGKAGGIIAPKGPISAAVTKGMGHTKQSVTPVSSDRGAFQIKG